MKKEEKKILIDLYENKFRRIFPWLPSGIQHVKDSHMQNLLAIELITGVKIVYDFLRLRNAIIK